MTTKPSDMKPSDTYRRLCREIGETLAMHAVLERWAVEHLSMREYWQCIGKAVVYPVVPPPTPASGGEGET